MRVVLILLLLVSTAHAEPWYRGRHGTNRIVHLSIATGGTLLYIATERVELELAPSECRWCDPTAADVWTRKTLRWNTSLNTAATMSHVTTYGLTPAVSAGLLLVNSDLSSGAMIDDLTPIAEAFTLSRWASRILKLSFGRQRPYAHYGPGENNDDNLAFPSGHATAAFAVAASAGMVAHLRRYDNEPYIWIAGLTLAATSSYLRIAADRHYLTDVVGGAVLGTAVGLTVPLLMRRDVGVSASRDVLAIGGVW